MSVCVSVCECMCVCVKYFYMYKTYELSTSIHMVLKMGIVSLSNSRQCSKRVSRCVLSLWVT